MVHSFTAAGGFIPGDYAGARDWLLRTVMGDAGARSRSPRDGPRSAGARMAEVAGGVLLVRGAVLAR